MDIKEGIYVTYGRHRAYVTGRGADDHRNTAWVGYVEDTHEHTSWRDDGTNTSGYSTLSLSMCLGPLFDKGEVPRGDALMYFGIDSLKKGFRIREILEGIARISPRAVIWAGPLRLNVLDGFRFISPYYDEEDAQRYSYIYLDRLDMIREFDTCKSIYRVEHPFPEENGIYFEKKETANADA